MYQKVMVPLDGSELAECVLPHVEAIGRGCNTEVVLVRVVEPFERLYRGAESRVPQEERARVEAQGMSVARDYLDNLKRRLEEHKLSVKTEVLLGNIAEKLVEYVEKGGFDLIIIASHGRSGVSRWVWGSVAERVLRSACIPVFVVRAPGCEQACRLPGST